MKEVLKGVMSVFNAKNPPALKTFDCSTAMSNTPPDVTPFERKLGDAVANNDLLVLRNRYSVEYFVKMSIITGSEEGDGSTPLDLKEVATVDNDGMELMKNATIVPTRRFYRIGITEVSLLGGHFPSTFDTSSTQ